MKILIIFCGFLLSLNSYALRVAVISDLNSSYGSSDYNQAVNKTVQQILLERPDLVLATGDLIAGQKAGLNYLAMWESFHRSVTAPLKEIGIPFAVTPGNHDGSAALKFKLEREIFRTQWKEHKAKLNYIHSENYPDYYAFVMDNILFVSLDATLVGKLSDKQFQWLQKVLTEKVNYRHKIVYGHLPIMPTVSKKANEVLSHTQLIKLFKQTKVSAYLSGHHHAYYPGKSHGIHHISQGCLGSGPRKLIGTSVRSPRSYTIIDLDSKFEAQAYNVENNFKLIDKKSLPTMIEFNNFKLIRDDL